MNHWKKTSLLTTIVLLLIFFGIKYTFNISLTIPSSNIEFSPGIIDEKAYTQSESEKPKNIILFMTDGMGFGHLSLALLTQQTDEASPIWYDFDVKSWQDPRAIYGPLTDSEASATAIATGTSTNFGHIGIDVEGNELQNVFELASEKGYSTGIVTDSYVWDGTPAAFATHTRNEDDARDILKQLAASDLDVLFGELEDVGEDDVPEVDESLQILETRFTLLDPSLEIPDMSVPIAAIYLEDEIQDMTSSPNLVQLTSTALEYLQAQENSFILLVESEEMDAASHNNDSDRVVDGLESIQETLAVVMDFVKQNGETLLVFTSDHETGGLAAASDFNSYPDMQILWSTKNHTAAMVPLFAKGPGSEIFETVNRNNEIGLRLISLIE